MRREAINTQTRMPTEPHRYAAPTLTHADRVQEGARVPARDITDDVLPVLHDVAALPGLTHRDTTTIYLTVLFRLLAFEEARELVFSRQDASVLRRRASRIADAGWISAWNAAKPRGGLERYIHPSGKALDEVLPQLRERTQSLTWAPLIRLMLPQRRRPLLLGRGAAPKWLAHQREVNKIVARSISHGAHQVLWASTWDCPFPTQAGILTLPQPDYVLIEARDGLPHLVFGEHDRGTEQVGTFIARKVELYAALASFPETCVQLFGIDAFEVRVSVADVRDRRPMHRLRTLAATASKYTVPMRFTLAGWLHAYADDPYWFSAATPPVTDSARRSDHDVPAA